MGVFKSKLARPRLSDTPLVWAAWIGGAFVVLFVCSLSVMSAGQAWAIVCAAESPRNVGGPVFAYALSIAGYILVPVAIAVAVNAMIQRSIRRRVQAPGTPEEAMAKFLLGDNGLAWKNNDESK
jgi:hypothetical protein